MLSAMYFNSFKSFIDQRIKLRPLTLLAGLNNSGKSSIIQAARMFSASAYGQSPYLEGHGGVDELLSKFSPEKECEISFSWEDNSIKTQMLKLTRTDVIRPCIAPSVLYVGADRLGPRVTLPMKNGERRVFDLGDRSEYVLEFLSIIEDWSVPKELRHDKGEGHTVFYQIRAWLEEISPGIRFDYKTDSKRDSSYTEIDSHRSTNVGFGLSYAFPILAAVLGLASEAEYVDLDMGFCKSCQDRKEFGSLLLVENPEAHLHPQGQTVMGKLLAIAASCGVQVLVETHSDHLMDGVRLAVKDGLLDADSVYFHYLSKETNCPTKLESPKLYSTGKLEYWPTGFFDQTLKNRAKLARK